jgi:acyl dehydratase
MRSRILHGEPRAATTLLRAALPSLPLVNRLPGIRRSGDFEGLVLCRPAVTLLRPQVTAYAGVCAFPVKDAVPLTYPHLLAFPLHLAILTDPTFPFPAIGAVHLRNSITAWRPLAIGETVSVTARADEVQAHPKGPIVDIDVRIDAGNETIWASTSTYLGRVRGRAEVPNGSRSPSDGPTTFPPGGVTWQLPGDLGRRYAAVSRDYNPIHLHPLTARALGFPRQIAHGMWSVARCVAAVENRLPQAVTVDVTFKKPIVLPGSVRFGVDSDVDGGLLFALTSPQNGAPHLVGVARPARPGAVTEYGGGSAPPGPPSPPDGRPG